MSRYLNERSFRGGFALPNESRFGAAVLVPRAVLLLLVAAAIFVTAGWPAPASAAPRPAKIVAGTPARDTAPWTAFVLPSSAEAYPGVGVCGAAVVSPTAVVTAAHCVLGRRGLRRVDVVTGRNTLSGSDGQRATPAAIDVDPSYSPRVHWHDIAVIHLSAPTAAPPVAIAAASQARLAAPGAKLLLTGWGLTRNNDFATPDGLRKATITAAGSQKCRAAYGKGFSSKALICSVPGRPAPCYGDSGSPLVSLAHGAPTLMGIVAFGDEWCATRKYPTAYTRVSYEAPFLTRVLGAAQAGTGLPPDRPRA